MSNKNNKIYFIQSENGLIKIGKSNNPYKRLKNLQIGSPVNLKLVKTVPGGMYLERILHYYFKDFNRRGEWFKPDYELKQFLQNKRRITITSIIDFYTKQQKPTKTMKRYIECLERDRLYL